MKILKTKTISILGLVSLALLLAACGNAGNTPANNSTANAASPSNTATVSNSNQTPASSPSPASKPSPQPSAKPEGETIEGQLQMGKSESVILYVGKETGDYAGYCFANDSEGGRSILAACKDKEQCQVIGQVNYEMGCKVPGLEADLSQSGRIVKVEAVKAVGRGK